MKIEQKTQKNIIIICFHFTNLHVNIQYLHLNNTQHIHTLIYICVVI